MKACKRLEREEVYITVNVWNGQATYMTVVTQLIDCPGLLLEFITGWPSTIKVASWLTRIDGK